MAQSMAFQYDGRRRDVVVGNALELDSNGCSVSGLFYPQPLVFSLSAAVKQAAVIARIRLLLELGEVSVITIDLQISGSGWQRQLWLESHPYRLLFVGVSGTKWHSFSATKMSVICTRLSFFFLFFRSNAGTNFVSRCQRRRRHIVGIGACSQSTGSRRLHRALFVCVQNKIKLVLPHRLSLEMAVEVGAVDGHSHVVRGCHVQTPLSQSQSMASSLDRRLGNLGVCVLHFVSYWIRRETCRLCHVSMGCYSSIVTLSALIFALYF